MRKTSLQLAILKRRLLIGAGLFAGFCAAAFWVLITPDNPLTNYFSAPISVRDTRVIVGPYPNESDFVLLKKNGVTAIVSLLDPKIPFENVLLGRERALAGQYGMSFQDFPMGSLFSHRIGGDYDKEAALAARAVAQSPGRVYLHCYLGMHRVAAVERLLAKQGTSTGEYLARHGERSEDAKLLDQAQAEYDSGDFRAALRSLFNISQKTDASQLLTGWATYRLGDIDQAKSDFAAVLALDPKSSGAALGVGYCALRLGDLAHATTMFARTLSEDPKNESALTGMGLALYRQGRSADAARYLREALAINPHDGDAKAELARIN